MRTIGRWIAATALVVLPGVGRLSAALNDHRADTLRTHGYEVPLAITGVATCLSEDEVLVEWTVTSNQDLLLDIESAVMEPLWEVQPLPGGASASTSPRATDPPWAIALEPTTVRPLETTTGSVVVPTHLTGEPPIDGYDGFLLVVEGSAEYTSGYRVEPSFTFWSYGTVDRPDCSPPPTAAPPATPVTATPTFTG